MWTHSYLASTAGNVSEGNIQKTLRPRAKMTLQKTVSAKILGLTHVREEKISGEYWNFQKALKGEDVQLYSAAKQQAERKKGWKRDGEHPLVLRRDCFFVKDELREENLHFFLLGFLFITT